MSSNNEDLDDYDIDVVSPTKPKPIGISNIGAISKLSGLGNIKKVEEEEKYQGEETVVIFKLPDGSMKKHKVKMGNAVESLKVLVEKEHGLDFASQSMYLNGKVLPNPLSLSDIEDIKANQENFIDIKMD